MPPRVEGEDHVLVNYYKLELETDKNPEWLQYEVQIVRAVRNKVCDQEKKFLRYEVVVNPNKSEPIDFSRGSEVSRRILKKLALDEKLPFVTDGKGVAYAPHRFFEGDSKVFDVVVPKDCDVDEVDSELVQNSRFKVKFTLVAAIHPTHAFANSTEDMNEYQKTRQALDIILKSAMTVIGMKAFGRNPRAFYFPDKMQPGVLQIQQQPHGGRSRNITFNDMINNVRKNQSSSVLCYYFFHHW